jgi:hypothetical protein
MRTLLNSGAVGNIELNAQKKIREDIQARWERLGLVKGLEGNVKETVATLYENQAKHLLREATASDNSGSFETVVFPLIRRVFSKLLANDIVSVQAMNLPIGKLFYIKPVTSEREWNFQTPGTLTAGDTGRHRGLMGYERTDRNENGAQNNRYYLPDESVTVEGQALAKVDQYVDEAGVRFYDDGNGNYYKINDASKIAYTPVGTTKAIGKGVVEPIVTQYMKKTLYDLFYNDFLYDNSKGKITICMGQAIPVQIAPDGSYQTLQSIPVFAQDGSVRSLLVELSGFHSYNAGHLTGPDGNEMDTEAFLASLKVIASKAITKSTGDFTTFAANESIQFRVVTQKYGDQLVNWNQQPGTSVVADPNGNMYIELDLTKPATKQGLSLDGYIGVDPNSPQLTIANITDAQDPLFKIAWCSYDSLELETEMGEVSFQLTSVDVAVEERKLRATWSPELAQDVSAFHNLDAEAELTAILSEQIAAEIDREILRDIRKAAPWTARWDYNGWQRLGTTSTVYTQKDWNQTLMTKINQISAQIQKATLRGGANWIIVSAEISAVLNDLEYFHVTDASAESDTYNMGIEKIGALQGRYNVTVDPYAPHWSLIMGHHGTSLLDTGYIYAPYVPMALTPTMYNPFNFAPIKGICTRYAKKLVNNRYYGAIKCDGLMHWDINEMR